MEELEQLAKERFEVIRDCYGKVIKEFEKLCDELSSGNQQKLKQIAFDKSADQIKDSLKLKEDAVMKIINDEKTKWKNVSAKHANNKIEWLEMSKNDVQEFKELLQGHCTTSLLEEHRDQLATPE